MKCTTGEIISVGTGKLCCSMDKVYEIMNFLTGDNLFTHQLPRAFEACKEHVTAQHPWLEQINEEDCTPETWKEWLAGVENDYGTEHELTALPPGEWLIVDPVVEAEVMFGKDKVVVVEGKGEGHV